MIFDFIGNNYILLLEGLSFIIGLVYVKKYWGTPIRMILLYLFLVFGIELVALNIGGDHWLYNILSLSELVIFAYIFYNSVDGLTNKRIILITTLICLLFLVLDVLFLTKSVFIYLSIGYGLASLGIALMCFIYILEMTKTEKVLHQNRELLYWVVIGLLIYHLCNLPATVMVNNLFAMGNIDLILNIQAYAGIGMYICFIIGFIWTRHLS